jgi:uncharacterized protein YdcH (DUF465 family)
MEMPLPEVIDRYTIVRLKSERIGKDEVADEFAALEATLTDYRKRGVQIKDEWVERLYELNGQIWDLEHDIRAGKEGELGLEEVGRRAIQIREINKQRVGIKNQIVGETGHGFKDVKMNHASA